MTDSAQRELKKISLPRTLTWAVVLITVDAFVFNQGIISALVGIWMLFISLPRAVFSKIPEQRHLRLARVVIFLVAVFIVIGLNRLNNQIAKNRAETLITAVKSFKQQYHRYPVKLDELVPEFIDHIPRAKYTLMLSDFRYTPPCCLYYVALPPFGRPTYNFESDKWGYID